MGEGSSADWLFELKLAICIGSRFGFKSKAHTHRYILEYSQYLAANLWMQKHSWLELDDSLWAQAWVLCQSLSNAKTSVSMSICVCEGDTQDEFNKLSKQWQTRKHKTTITITKRNVLNAAYQRSQLRAASRAVFQPLQLSRFRLRP